MIKKIVNILISGPFIFVIGSIIGLWLASEMFFWWSLFIIIITGIYWAVWKDNRKAKREFDERQKEHKQEQERIRKRLNKLRPIYKKSLSELVVKYGKPDKIINLEPFDLKKSIIVFSGKRRIWLLGRDLSMESIMDCRLQNDEHNYSDGLYNEIETKTGNMIKRAAVGTLVAGTAGAVIGGATAKRTTTSNTSANYIWHDYYVYVFINDLSEPVVKIDTNGDANRANEIVGLFSVIIERNKNHINVAVR